MQRMISSQAGIGEYSAIVYYENGSLVAKTRSGTTVSSGTLNTDDDTVIQAAIDYVNGLGGGKVFITRPPSGEYLLDATVIIKSHVFVEVEQYTTFVPTTNSNVFQAMPDFGLSGQGDGFTIDTEVDATWSAVQLLLDGGSSGSPTPFKKGYNRGGHIENIIFKGYNGLGHGTALRFYTNGTATVGEDYVIFGIFSMNLTFFGFENQIHLYHGSVQNWSTAWINDNVFINTRHEYYYNAIKLQNDCGTAAAIYGNQFICTRIQGTPSTRNREITVVGDSNWFTELYIWDVTWDTTIDAGKVIYLPAPAGLPGPYGAEHCHFSGIGLSWLNLSANYLNRMELLSPPEVHSVTSAITYVVNWYENIITCNTAAGPITLTLPKAQDHQGRPLTIKRLTTDANQVTINAASGNTIDGEATEYLAGGMKYGITLVPSELTWAIIGDSGSPKKLIGAMSTDTSNTTTQSANLYAFQATAGATRSVTQIRVKCPLIGSNIKVAIWADNGSDAPGDLLGNSGAFTPTVAAGWNTVPLSVPVPIVAGAKYWIGFQTADGAGTSVYGWDGTGNLYAVLVGSDYASFPPNPFGTPTATGERKYLMAGWG